MNPYREELRNMLASLDTERPASLRRSRSDQWLYATDLPMAASEETLEVFSELAHQAGWKTGMSDGWLQLDRPIRILTPGMIPEECRFRPAAACCRSLLERHRDDLIPSDGQAERLLIKAGEEGPEAYEEACRKLHSLWAESLRTHHGIPAVQLTFFDGGNRYADPADSSCGISD